MELWVGEITRRMPESSWGIPASERRQEMNWKEFRDKHGE